MDYGRFRTASQNGAQSVAVNHRALITRTLTKYPVDYALFRELLQNSADAQATAAVIRFQSAKSSSEQSSIHRKLVNRLTFTNNGADFAKDDWERLREIARGNPNEGKIGAFGVGFYSVFELTDQPLVHSGDSVMTFRFDGDQLQYVQSEAPYLKGTLIDLPYRESSIMPDLTKFTAFLTQSLMLVDLEKTEVYLDDKLIYRLSKKVAAPSALNLSDGLETRSPLRMFKLVGLSSSRVNVELEYLNASQMAPTDLSTASGLFSFGKTFVTSLLVTPDKPEDYTKSAYAFKRVNAVLDVSVSSSFSKSMQATVMKPPPRRAHMSLLTYSPSDVSESDLEGSFGEYIFPKKFENAKVFIGFPTKQSSPFKSHLAINQLIPTMERTAVDMSNAHVKDWNGQLLYMAGVVARCVYENELTAAAKSGDVSAQLKAASFTISRLVLGPSAPDPLISRWASSGFWQSTKTLSLPTQLGVKSSKITRTAGNIPESLLKRTPIVRKSAIGGSETFWEQLRSVSYVRKISLDEAIRDIEGGVLSIAEFGDAVRWLTSAEAALSTSERKKVLGAIVVVDTTVEDMPPKTITMGQIKYFQNKAVIPDSIPLPDDAVPASFVHGLLVGDLHLLGWTELTLSTNVKFLISSHTESQVDKSLELNPDLSIELLSLLSHAWQSISKSEKAELGQLLHPVSVIPTQLGMKRPGEAYLQKIALFPDLPVVSSHLRAARAFLTDISVRESVDMALVLKILHDPGSTNLHWSNHDLVEYLAENQSKLRASDWKLLKEGLFFTAKGSSTHAKASDLYPPDSLLVRLRFRTLDWPTDSLSTTAAGLLSKLGLRRAPPVAELFNQGLKLNLIPTAMKFYLSNFSEAGYSARDFASMDPPVVPTNTGLARPSEVYVEKEAGEFGLSVLDRGSAQYAHMLGVANKPPIAVLLAQVYSQPPNSLPEAEKRFSYLSSRSHELSRDDISTASKLPFIPIGGDKLQHASPDSVFLTNSEGGSELKGIFHFIDPVPSSVPFLIQVGVKQAPTLTQIAHATASDPRKVLKSMDEDASKYKGLLAKFQNGWSELKRDKALTAKMAESTMLLGYRVSDGEKPPVPVLEKANNIVLVDNIILYNQFKMLVTAAPQEAGVEGLYTNLGSHGLSAILFEQVQLGDPVENEERRDRIESHLKERLTLFLESTTKDRGISTQDVGKFRVQLVQVIKIRRKLANTPSLEAPTSAYIRPQDRWTVYVTEEFDWFDLAEVLAKAALKRPDPESVIVLELQMNSSLDSLQRKGYNVMRLLRKQQELESAARLKLEEERIQAEEQRKEELREKQKSLELEKAKQSNRIEETKKLMNTPDRHLPDERSLMTPATRPESGHTVSHENGPAAPSRPSAQPPFPKVKSSGTTVRELLSNLASSVRGALPESASTNQTGGPLLAPPTAGQAQVPAIGDFGQSKQPSASPDVLQKGVASSRPYGSGELRAQNHVDVPQVSPVTCQENKVHDIVRAGTAKDGLKLFRDRHSPEYTEEQLRSVTNFERILQYCSQIFEFPWSTVSIFVEDGSTVAFNSGGSLFYNLQYYIATEPWPVSRQLDYWYTVTAHELAHNFVRDHGESHSFYSESYTHTYLERLRSIVATL